MSSSSSSSAAQQQQQQQNASSTTTQHLIVYMRNSQGERVVRVPFTRPQPALQPPPGTEATAMVTNPVIAQPPPGRCHTEEAQFIQEFAGRILLILQEFRQQYPYGQTIKWSIKLGDGREFSINFVVNPNE